jgi:hypothetical protein
MFQAAKVILMDTQLAEGIVFEVIDRVDAGREM